MKKRTSAIAATVLALGLTVAAVVPANAQSGAGTSTCSSTYSYTWANSTQSIAHRHESGGQWVQSTKPAGVSSYKGWYKPGPVYMTLNTAGNFSGAVYGCTA
jgi:hypothetical protein